MVRVGGFPQFREHITPSSGPFMSSHAIGSPPPQGTDHGHHEGSAR